MPLTADQLQGYLDTIYLLQLRIDELKARVAGAYLAAAECAEHYPEAEGYVCQDIAASIRHKTPADAARSLQVYAQERVLEEANWWTLAFASLSPAAFKAAATARLAELRNTKA